MGSRQDAADELRSRIADELARRMVREAGLAHRTFTRPEPVTPVRGDLDIERFTATTDFTFARAVFADALRLHGANAEMLAHVDRMFALMVPPVPSPVAGEAVASAGDEWARAYLFLKPREQPVDVEALIWHDHHEPAVQAFFAVLTSAVEELVAGNQPADVVVPRYVAKTNLLRGESTVAGEMIWASYAYGTPGNPGTFRDRGVEKRLETQFRRTCRELAALRTLVAVGGHIDVPDAENQILQGFRTTFLKLARDVAVRKTGQSEEVVEGILFGPGASERTSEGDRFGQVLDEYARVLDLPEPTDEALEPTSNRLAELLRATARRAALYTRTSARPGGVDILNDPQVKQGFAYLAQEGARTTLPPELGIEWIAQEYGPHLSAALEGCVSAPDAATLGARRQELREVVAAAQRAWAGRQWGTESGPGRRMLQVLDGSRLSAGTVREPPSGGGAAATPAPDMRVAYDHLVRAVNGSTLALSLHGLAVSFDDVPDVWQRRELEAEVGAVRQARADSRQAHVAAGLLAAPVYAGLSGASFKQIPQGAGSVTSSVTDPATRAAQTLNRAPGQGAARRIGP